MPSISVLITAYNVERYIGRAIRSALSQSIPNEAYEIIVINDCSYDRTRFALEVFEDDIKLINNKNRLGLPASLNKGIKKAKGRFVVRQDGDDYIHKDFLKVLDLHLSLNDDIDAIACDYLLVDNDEHILGKMNCMEHPIACGIMFRIDQLIDIGMYDENFIAREDEDLRIRFLQKYNIERVQIPLYRYRRHDNNLTNNKKVMRKYDNMLTTKHFLKD
ncbi:glycosyltransferase family 2 protein [candidate division KSB1 bacterium]|nr:glycosyltransferase family 2 protein [candidate division KSB1 bacterium]